MMVRNQLSWQALKPSALYRRSFNFVAAENHWTTGGLPSGTRVSAHASFELPNFWGTSLTVNAADFGAAHCVACARGGPAVRQSAKRDMTWTLSGDPRRALIPRLSLSGGTGDEGKTRAAGTSLGGELRIASSFSMSLDASYRRRNDDQQWIGNYGAVLSDTTHFTFAHLDQTTLGVTSRVNWTASPTLSLQLYVEPFMSTGRFNDWRELADARATAYDDRYRPYRAGTAPSGFSYRQFNSNAVMRWEYRPASTLFLVWQQGRLQSDAGRGDFRFARDYRDLFRAHPDNTLLVKLAYWLSP